MNFNYYKHKNTSLLIIFYGLALILSYWRLEEFGIHIEEKFHRLNGLYWLNYLSEIFGFSDFQDVTQKKINDIYDYTLNRPSYFNRYGIVLDLPAAYLEIIFQIDEINKIYYLKHFMGYSIFLLSSLFFYKILFKRFNNYFLSFVGLIIYITTPRIFGDSFLYKDVLYLSFFTMTLYFFLESIGRFNVKNLILLAFFTALSVNLRIFSIILPLLFIFILIIKNFYNKNSADILKKILIYFFFFLIFLYMFWPYLWSNPLDNFYDIFKFLTRDLIDVKILYDNNYISNRIVPDSYILNWIMITSPVLQFLIFIFGLSTYLLRLGNRFLKVTKNSIHNDLWRSKKEEIDFVFFLFFITFYLLFLISKAPMYNGWRLVYFLNIFIVYFAVLTLDFIKIKFYKIKYLKKSFILLSIFVILQNVHSIIKFHPYQSIYFNNFLSEKTINGYEGDYHGVGTKHFFQKLLEIEKGNKINVAVASHTPIQRGLEGLSLDDSKKFNILGQEYHLAEYIFKNNISEVNARLIKKYEVPKNFSKIYEFKKNKISIYEIYKKN